jgi:serine/threonine protein kinase
MQKQAVGAGMGQGAVQQVQQNQGFVPAWMRNAQAASSGTNTVWKQGDAMDPQKFKVMWRANGGTKMQQGGFGYVYFGGYDATPNPKARPLSINTAIKLPNTDPDSVKAHYLEMEINKKIAADGGVPGVADFIGTVDLSPIKAQLPPGIGAMDGIVWRTVEGKTLDNFFDRGGGMSPVLANVLKVTDSKPTKIKGGVCYIKTELCRNVLGRTLIPLTALHEKGIIHRDLKPRNIMLAEKDPQNPLCIIDFGSAITKGSRPFMNDFTAVYAPPEAPEPDFFKPESYDIFHLGITGLRVLMPSLIAGENGIATLGKVATVEIPGYDYDLRAWATARATDTASRFEFKALNAECEALLNQPELMDLLCKMLDKNPANRPSAEQCIQMLGPEWVARLQEYREGRQSRGNCGTCGQPVYSSDKGRFRDARGTYFHEGCAQMYS